MTTRAREFESARQAFASEIRTQDNRTTARRAIETGLETIEKVPMIVVYLLIDAAGQVKRLLQGFYRGNNADTGSGRSGLPSSRPQPPDGAGF